MFKRSLSNEFHLVLCKACGVRSWEYSSCISNIIKMTPLREYLGLQHTSARKQLTLDPPNTIIDSVGWLSIFSQMFFFSCPMVVSKEEKRPSLSTDWRPFSYFPPESDFVSLEVVSSLPRIRISKLFLDIEIRFRDTFPVCWDFEKLKSFKDSSPADKLSTCQL